MRIPSFLIIKNDLFESNNTNVVSKFIIYKCMVKLGNCFKLRVSFNLSLTPTRLPTVYSVQVNHLQVNYFIDLKLNTNFMLSCKWLNNS